MLQVIFHGTRRSIKVEDDIAARFEALKRFDDTIGEGRVTISREGRQGQGSFSAKIDLSLAGRSNVVASEEAPEMTAAVNKLFDTIRRVVKDENDKRRGR